MQTKKRIVSPTHESVQQCAARKGVSIPTLYRIFARGEIKCVKMGRRTLVLVDSADRYFDNLPVADIRTV